MTTPSTETKIFISAEELIEKAVALLQIQLEKALDQGSEAAPSDVLGLIKESQAMMFWHSNSITVSNRRKASFEAFQIRYKNSENFFMGGFPEKVRYRWGTNPRLIPVQE
jgi:hypothetical protein